MYAVLIDEPFFLRFSEIEKLTDRQIFQLYFRQRDKDGTAKQLPDPEVYRKVLDADKIRENYMAMGAALGLTQAKLKQGMKPMEGY